MGQGQQKQVINPNNQTTNKVAQKSDQKLLAYIREALRNCSTNGTLTKDNFNQMLAVLENIGFKRLRDTPLADRLYFLFDKSRTGFVSEQEFSNGINELIYDKNAALNYTFKAYDADGDNRISKREFVQIIEQTWRTAFRMLAQKQSNVNMRDIQYWASSKVQILNEYSTKIFNKMDSGNKGVLILLTSVYRIYFIQIICNEFIVQRYLCNIKWRKGCFTSQSHISASKLIIKKIYHRFCIFNNQDKHNQTQCLQWDFFSVFIVDGGLVVFFLLKVALLNDEGYFKAGLSDFMGKFWDKFYFKGVLFSYISSYQLSLSSRLHDEFNSDYQSLTYSPSKLTIQIFSSFYFFVYSFISITSLNIILHQCLFDATKEWNFLYSSGLDPSSPASSESLIYRSLKFIVFQLFRLLNSYIFKANLLFSINAISKFDILYSYLQFRIIVSKYLEQLSKLINNEEMGFQVQDYPVILKTGISAKYSSIKSLFEPIDLCVRMHNDKIICPIFTDEYLLSVAQKYDNTQTNTAEKRSLSLDHCLIPSDVTFRKNAYHLFNPQINSCVLQKKFPQGLRNELIHIIAEYSSFLNLTNFVIRLPFKGVKSETDNQQKMNVILQSLKNTKVKNSIGKSFSRIIFLIELNGDNEAQGNTQSNQIIWKQYIRFIGKVKQISYKLKFQVILQFKANLPNSHIINRWKSEKIFYIIFQSDCFIENSKGFKTLPAKHQRIFLEFANLRAGAIINFNGNEEKCEDYFKYLHFSFRKMAQNTLRSAKSAINLIDYLQDPLQPYADNLESLTYQIFQNDEIKYDQYQAALEEAFQKLPKNQRIVIYYIGAGRGGLLFNVFAAAKKKNRKIYVYAIQKNPYPIQTIKARANENRWKQHMTIVQSDIRDYVMPEKPDIFLSELLGGFGDNQLSPECLFWAQKNIHETTICIPQSYTSYIKPISYQGVHRELSKENRHFYYTTNLGSYYTNFRSKPVWQYKHPLQNGEKQFCKDSEPIQFEAKQDIIINGFSGYFMTELYGFSQLSILPQNPTLGSYSWFPLFFPFEQEVFLQKGEKIIIKMSRKNDNKQVWYEWQYNTKDQQSIIHNKDGWKIVIEL